MRSRLRPLLWLAALVVAFILVWSRVRIFFVVRLGWWQLLALVLVLALVLYLLVNAVLDRLGR